MPLNWACNAPGLGGPQAHRSRHQAPARRPQGRSCARRAPHLARRRIAHHHPLGARRRLLVGGRAAPSARRAGAGLAPDPPARRESITCEINLPRAGADRKVAGIVAQDEAGAFYLAHSGRLSKSGFREFLADGVWRTVQWPDGEETEALVVAPLDSPRLTRLLGRFVDSVRRFKEGDAPPAQPGLCVEPSAHGSAGAACDRSLVDSALHEELSKRGLFGGTVDLFSLRGARPQPLFALIADGGEELALAVGSLSLAAARSAVRPILIAPAELAEQEGALAALPFACVRYRWRGARAVFDGLDDALA